MPAPGTIIVVCTANVCRSPMAAALLQHALAAQPEPLRSLNVISAGVAARAGDRVSENSVIALKKVGLDIAKHVSRPLTQQMINEASLILGMTESHRVMINLQAEPTPKRLHLFREFMPQRGDKEIGDPFGGPLKLYEATRDEMVEAVPSLIEFIKANLVRK
jgi:protein-tyrosine-phosphatase